MKNRTKVIDRLRRDARDMTVRLPFERGEPRQSMIARRDVATLHPGSLAGIGASRFALLAHHA